MGRSKVILVLALAIGAAGICAGWRKADLRGFEPAGMARLETAMWRDYYEKHYPQLFYHLYEVSRAQFGFAPLASVRIALSAAQAAKTFQPTRSRREADAALPYLVTYYRLLLPAAPAAFDVDAAARLELDWWQARRETVGPQRYGLTVAEVTALTYGKNKDDPVLRESGVARAEAMAYRDARGSAMTAEDWSAIEARLARLRFAQGRCGRDCALSAKHQRYRRSEPPQRPLLKIAKTTPCKVECSSSRPSLIPSRFG